MKHIKFYILILFSFSCILAKAQQCETYDGTIINCLDKDFLKQGFWYEYQIQKILTTDSFKRNPKAIGLHNNLGKIETPLAAGYYKNNKRIGEWKFYKGQLYNDNLVIPTSHIQAVIFTDSGYFKIIDSFWNFIAVVSNDTNNLRGKIYLKEDLIEVNCKDKFCYLKDPYKKNKKQKFPIRELDNKLIWFKFRNLRNKKI